MNLIDPKLMLTPVSNHQAVAVLMAFQNVVHDLIHAGLEPQAAFAVLVQHSMDVRDLLAGKKVQIRGHGPEDTLSLDSENAQRMQTVLNSLLKDAAQQAVMKDSKGQEIVATAPTSIALN